MARALEAIQPAARLAARLGLIESPPRVLAVPPELELRP